MKKFRFRFEKILAYRHFQEKQKQRDLADVNTLEQQQIHHLSGVLQDRTNHQRNERIYHSGVINPQNLTMFSRYYIKLKQMEIVGKGALKEIKKEVEKRRQVLIKATRQRKIYEKLKERHKEKYVFDTNLIMQKQNDEIGQSMYFRDK